VKKRLKARLREAAAEQRRLNNDPAAAHDQWTAHEEGLSTSSGLARTSPEQLLEAASADSSARTASLFFFNSCCHASTGLEELL
jgi:hypothetical protein